MNPRSLPLGLCVALAFSGLHAQTAAIPSRDFPRLEKRGAAVQLIVDGKPYLALAGELHNSSSTSRAYMKPLWPKLATMNLNTVLAAVPWGMVEPKENVYDFSMVDQLIEDARSHQLRLVLLWFGSWKNGLSHYVPAWVKADTRRFPLVKTRHGTLEILSPLDEANREADAKAFAAFMRHVKEVDAARKTVIMIQVENEVGVHADARDRSELANTAFGQPVARELLDYLQKNRDRLAPGVRGLWQSSNFRTSGHWGEVFGQSPAAEELFMAWAYARYLNRVAEAGKKEYALPMFVNAWIVQPEDEFPGEYPSGGPQAHVLDVWRAGAPQIDFFAPDIYLPNFGEVCAEFAHPDSGFFVPEARAGAEGAANAFLAIGAFNSIGYSPFGIDSREALLAHPKVGASFEGFAIEQVVARLGAQRDECFFWGLHSGAELDLLVTRGRHRLGFEVKLTDAPRITPSMRSALDALELTRLDVIHAGEETFPLSEQVRAVALRRVLSDIDPL